MSIDGKSDIRELQALGDWAALPQYQEVTIASKNGSSPMQFAGNTLSILRKEPIAGGSLRATRIC